MTIDDNPSGKPSVPVLEEIVVPGNPESLKTTETDADTALNLPSIDSIDTEAIAPLLKQIAIELQEDFKQEILDELIPMISTALKEQVNRHETSMQQKMVFLLQEHLPKLIQALHNNQKK